jgi:non-specific serine/threonine protein kinase
MRLKGASQDIAQLAAGLGVQYVLEGSVRGSGSQLRVTAKLIDVGSDSLVWGQKYAGTLEDVFAIQESISRAIVDALRVTLSADEDRRLAAHPIRDVRAFEAYLRAKQEAQRFTQEGLDRAIEYLEKASAIEGDSIVLLAARGQVYWQYINAGLSTDLAYLDRADACAARVLALDPESPLGHRLVGLVHVHRGDMAASLRALKRSLEREPNDPDTLFWAAIAAAVYGQTDLAATWAARLVEIDPLTPVHHFAFGVVAMMRGDFALALATFAKHYTSVLDTPPARLVYGQALSLNGRLDEAFGVWRDLERDMPESPFSQLGRFYRLALEGKPDEAVAVVTPEVAEAFRRDPQYAWLVAECYAIAGDIDQALTWTETAVACGLLNRRLLQEFDPFLAPIRGEPRFQALMREVETREKAARP